MSESDRPPGSPELSPREIGIGAGVRPGSGGRGGMSVKGKREMGNKCGKRTKTGDKRVKSGLNFSPTK